jgi:hypothetical protein
MPDRRQFLQAASAVALLGGTRGLHAADSAWAAFDRTLAIDASAGFGPRPGSEDGSLGSRPARDRLRRRARACLR